VTPPADRFKGNRVTTDGLSSQLEQSDGNRPKPGRAEVPDTQGGGRAGVAYGLAAYLWWGLVPIYFKAVADIPALEVLAHRVIWSVLLLLVLLRLKRRLRTAPSVLRDRRNVATLLGTTVLIALNWFVFIWAVANDQILQASLGYFINPLVNVALGFIFLRERLRGWQMVSVAMAGIGVVYLAGNAGEFPAIALVLAGSFALYGLLRKTARVDALLGLFVETVLLLPLALAYVGYLALHGQCRFGGESWPDSILLALGGIVTAMPLLWFTNAARRLRLATLGFLQYIAPTGQFLLAVAVFDEAFTPAHRISFGFIWAALYPRAAEGARA
jgi:chloramphenicol-sensitive protein RarD